MTQSKKKVFVGLSGGVDSSVAALRLLKAGYDVTGVFIMTWHPDFISCTEEEERLDAMRVAAHLKIPFRTFDARNAYKKEVGDYMIREYKAGRTPNPDVMCNKHVKFGTFLNYALKNGATHIATGHYTQVREVTEKKYELLRGVDQQKDQSYFLWTLSNEILAHVLFPIGDTEKKDIRKEAEKAKLPTHSKKDSQGVCFLGDIDMKDFLKHYIHTEIGDVINESGEVIGSHDGAVLYTLGERHGFKITETSEETKPHYIVNRNMETNTVTVSTEKPISSKTSFTISETMLRVNDIATITHAECRYRQKPFKVTVSGHDAGELIVHITEEGVDAPTIGQSCVFYGEDVCIGGGIIRNFI